MCVCVAFANAFAGNRVSGSVATFNFDPAKKRQGSRPGARPQLSPCQTDHCHFRAFQHHFAKLSEDTINLSPTVLVLVFSINECQTPMRSKRTATEMVS